eukprot:CAMPEP_0180796500 /NCGR_PEP_ID=MMETSP1038_2-20121128/56824_1 /TAXON_ID=632150 /ORGANISM="Azadinium spinosum, Strain 3D9" /LENGTH=98 /DNA_ID=CAMNT_0022835607 /DNA_START=100 /DNA_END=396 /DNA_ORIENTATION=-
MAPPKGKYAGQGGEACRDVHHDAPGEVPDALRCEVATAPDHVAPRAVHKDQPQDQQGQPRHIAEPVGKGTRHQSRGDHGEHALVESEEHTRDLRSDSP